MALPAGYSDVSKTLWCSLREPLSSPLADPLTSVQSTRHFLVFTASVYRRSSWWPFRSHEGGAQALRYKRHERPSAVTCPRSSWVRRGVRPKPWSPDPCSSTSSCFAEGGICKRRKLNTLAFTQLPRITDPALSVYGVVNKVVASALRWGLETPVIMGPGWCLAAQID